MFYAAIGLNAAVIAMLIWCWFTRRRIFLLPSTWVLVLSVLFYMLPALLAARDIAELSPYTWIAMGYCSAFVGAGLLINLLVPELSWFGRRWTPVGKATFSENRRVGRYLAGVIVLLAVITVWYLLYVPITSTGLYGLLLDPDNYAQMREESLKLLDSRPLQYAYLMGFSCLSPLAFCLLLERLASLRAMQAWILGIAVTGFLAFYLLITGARVGLVNLAVAGLLYALLTNRLRIGWKSMLAAVAVVWMVPIALSMLRERGRGDVEVIDYLFAVGDRIFLLPLLISGWFVEFAEVHGYAGFGAALGIGQQVDWTNQIALDFLGRRDDVAIESVTTPTSFFFTNYLYFGWLGLIPSVAALKLLDLPLRYLGALPDSLLRPFLAVALFFSNIIVRAGFGVTVISHGYLILAMLILFAGRDRRSVRSASSPNEGAALERLK